MAAAAIAGAAGGAAASGGMSGLESMFQFIGQKHETRRAYSRWLKGLREGPSHAVAGLRAAGLNPILAAMSGGVGSSAAGIASAGRGGGGGGDFSGFSRISDSARGYAKLSPEKRLVSASARSAEAEANAKSKPWLSKDVTMADKQQRAATDAVLEQPHLMRAQRFAADAQASAAVASARQMQAAAQLSEYGFAGAQAESEFWKSLATSGSTAKGIQQFGALVLRALGR